MSAALFIEQTLNGLQQGIMLFLLAAGLTLVFGIIRLINLAHGTLYMVGAYAAAVVTERTGSFALGALAAVAAAGLAGIVIEVVTLRRLYARDHLDQVLATFGVILFCNEAVKMLCGPQALFAAPPPFLAGTVTLIPGAPYPAYRLFIIAAGLAVALGLGTLIVRTRLGMRIRAGASNREMLSALGVDVRRLYTVVFALGAMLAGLAGALAGPMLAVEVGMGENILILTFVVIIIGGIGSVRGALIGAILVGLVDTYGRAFLPTLMHAALGPSAASGTGAAIANVAIYVLMAAVLVWRPHGLFRADGA